MENLEEKVTEQRNGELKRNLSIYKEFSTSYVMYSDTRNVLSRERHTRLSTENQTLSNQDAFQLDYNSRLLKEFKFNVQLLYINGIFSGFGRNAEELYRLAYACYGNKTYDIIVYAMPSKIRTINGSIRGGLNMRTKFLRKRAKEIDDIKIREREKPKQSIFLDI